jgi:RNA polymerase sigma factor (sigma-70 family)
VRRNLEFKNFSPSHRLRELVEELIARLDRHAQRSPTDTPFLRLFIDENAARKLYHVSLTCDVPGRMLAAQEERHNAEEAVREAFVEIERQLERHKETLSHSSLYKRPARREELRRQKAEAFPAEERERELFSTLAERHLKNLYNFVRREIAYYLATGDHLPGEITTENVVDATLLQAYREFVKDPARREIKSWLIGLAVEKVEAEVKRSKVERAGGVHIEEDIPEPPPSEEVSTPVDEIMDFYQPDEDQELEDIITDITAPTPEQILESRELQRYINCTLATLPRVWRRAFALHYVGGMPVAEIARMTKDAESEVERHLEYAREYLSQRLRENGFEAPPHDQVALKIFGAAGDVEVPAAFRDAVIEKYKRLEEAENV